MGKSLRASTHKRNRHSEIAIVTESVEKPRLEEMHRKLTEDIERQNQEAGGPVIESVPEPTSKILKLKKKLTGKTKKVHGALKKPTRTQLKHKSSRAGKFLGH